MSSLKNKNVTLLTQTYIPLSRAQRDKQPFSQGRVPTHKPATQASGLNVFLSADILKHAANLKANIFMVSCTGGIYLGRPFTKTEAADAIENRDNDKFTIPTDSVSTNIEDLLAFWGVPLIRISYEGFNYIMCTLTTFFVQLDNFIQTKTPASFDLKCFYTKAPFELQSQRDSACDTIVKFCKTAIQYFAMFYTNQVPGSSIFTVQTDMLDFPSSFDPLIWSTKSVDHACHIVSLKQTVQEMVLLLPTRSISTSPIFAPC